MENKEREKLILEAAQTPASVIDQLLKIIDQQTSELKEQQNRIEEQRSEIEQLRRLLFGPSSEKLSAAQETELAEVAEDLQEQVQRPEADSVEILEPEESPVKARQRGRRHPFPAHVEVQTQVLEPEVCCHCGELGTRIGEEVSQEYDLIPAHVVVRRVVRVKRVCRCGCGGVAIAPLPPKLLPGSRLGIGLAVFILLSKFDDHLALYTLEKIFRERHGVIIPRQQMVQWIEVMAGLLRLLTDRMWQNMKRGNYLQIDESPVKVLDPEVKGKAGKGYLWFFGVPGGDVFLEYSDSRGHTVPLQLLEDFAGAFQSDGFEGYQTLERKKPELKRLGCAAHSRRKFYQAALEKDRQGIWFISRFRQLYKLEDEVRQMLPEDRQKERQAKAPKIWEEMKSRAQELQPVLLPQSSMGKAIRYFLNEYDALLVYLESPDYQIDNNLIENAIRPSCVGKKRWLFIGHPDAGWRSAVIYSIIQSCRRRGINPQDYLTDVLTRLPALKNTELEPLLPGNWKPPHQ